MASICYKTHQDLIVLSRYKEYKGMLQTHAVPTVDQNVILPTMRSQSPYFQGGQETGYRFLSKHA